MHISEINIYPIKSLKGISLDSAVVEERGLQYDRRWMLTTPDGMFFTQREFPQMALITVKIDSGGLRVESENAGGMAIPFEPDRGTRGRVTVWSSSCDAVIYNGEISEWFSDVIGTNCQLVYMPDGSRRSVNPRFNKNDDVVSFADGYPLMVLGEASLTDLNERLADNFDPPPSQPKRLPPLLRQGGEVFKPLPMNRFRPNLVVSESDAYAEDDWQRIRIGEAEFRGTKPCERCVITTVEQSRGEFDGKEPLKTLATYRRAEIVMPERVEQLGVTKNAVIFGQNLIAENAGSVIRVGDAVEILEPR